MRDSSNYFPPTAAPTLAGWHSVQFVLQDPAALWPCGPAGLRACDTTRGCTDSFHRAIFNPVSRRPLCARPSNAHVVSQCCSIKRLYTARIEIETWPCLMQQRRSGHRSDSWTSFPPPPSPPGPGQPFVSTNIDHQSIQSEQQFVHAALVSKYESGREGGTRRHAE